MKVASAEGGGLHPRRSAQAGCNHPTAVNASIAGFHGAIGAEPAEGRRSAGRGVKNESDRRLGHCTERAVMEYSRADRRGQTGSTEPTELGAELKSWARSGTPNFAPTHYIYRACARLRSQPC